MKIALSDLRKIVKEEIGLVQEEVDHTSIRSVVNAASRMLKALDDFQKAEPTAAMMSGLSTLMNSMRKSLEDMVQSPGSYVDKPGPKVLTVKKPGMKISV